MTAPVRSAGCVCGAVRLTVTGEPKRVGLCHCLRCRKAHGAAFNPFVVFDTAQVRWSGEVAHYQSSPAYNRMFCPVCGSRVAALSGPGEIEISVGTFDDEGQFAPQYEIWTAHREPWLPDLGLPSHRENGPG